MACRSGASGLGGGRAGGEGGGGGVAGAQYKSSMNYDPFSHEQIFPKKFKFPVYGLHLQVLIIAAADELYSRYTGHLFTDTISLLLNP
jgi:hypothetical protein